MLALDNELRQAHETIRNLEKRSSAGEQNDKRPKSVSSSMGYFSLESSSKPELSYRSRYCGLECLIADHVICPYIPVQNSSAMYVSHIALAMDCVLLFFQWRAQVCLRPVVSLVVLQSAVSEGSGATVGLRLRVEELLRPGMQHAGCTGFQVTKS